MGDGSWKMKDGEGSLAQCSMLNAQEKLKSKNTKTRSEPPTSEFQRLNVERWTFNIPSERPVVPASIFHLLSSISHLRSSIPRLLD